MYTLSHAIPVNPAGAEPTLTQAQVWRGLEIKAENAMPFVDGMTQCDVDSREANVITRTITFRGTQHRERITLFAPVKVQFERLDGTGWIDNVISESADGLLLAFTFGITFPGIAEGSPDEQAQGDTMRGAYTGAVAATLNRVRQMVRDGELA
ncbi:SRPBCC family protein [Sphingopyxis sp.]|uniref:SRPBCC family protein n=1 Tax=Sphingopyxis sp. TaxID=1908224 RepID=UPI003BAA0375